MKNTLLQNKLSNIRALCKKSSPYTGEDAKLIDELLAIRSSEIGNILNILLIEIIEASKRNDAEILLLCTELFTILQAIKPELLDEKNANNLTPVHHIFHLTNILNARYHGRFFTLLYSIARSGYNFNKCFADKECEKTLKEVIKREDEEFYEVIFASILLGSDFFTYKNAFDVMKLAFKKDAEDGPLILRNDILIDQIWEAEKPLKHLYKLKHGKELKDGMPRKPGDALLQYMASCDVDKMIVPLMLQQHYFNSIVYKIDSYEAEAKLDFPMVLKKLRHHGFDVNFHDYDKGQIPIVYAARHETPEVLKILIPGAEKYLLNLALTNAVSRYTPVKLEIISMLLDAGAQADLVLEGKTRSPLHYAALKGHNEILKLFIEHSTLKGEESFNIDVSINPRQITPLYLAALNNRIDCMKTLIDAGADVKKISDEQWLIWSKRALDNIKSNIQNLVQDIAMRCITPYAMI